MRHAQDVDVELDEVRAVLLRRTLLRAPPDRNREAGGSAWSVVKRAAERIDSVVSNTASSMGCESSRSSSASLYSCQMAMAAKTRKPMMLPAARITILSRSTTCQVSAKRRSVLPSVS